MLTTGALEKHIYEDLQPAYAQRYHRMLKAIQTHLLPLGLTMPQAEGDVAGGYFVWLTLPPPLDANAIFKLALETEDLTIIAGPKFRVDGDEHNPATKFERDIRLCFAWEELDLLEEGVVRLARVIKQAMVHRT